MKAQPDYYARLLSYSGGRMATQVEMDALDEANRGDR